MTTNYNAAMERRKITYKLYPSNPQRDRLNDLLHLHKNLYNGALEERIDVYRKTGKGVGFVDQSNSLKEIRESLPDYSEINSTALQQTLRRLDKAFAAFFRRCDQGEKPGFPRFKSPTRFPGITYGSYGSEVEKKTGKRRKSGKSGWHFSPGNKWKHGRLYLSDIGTLTARGKARTGGKLCHAHVFHRRGQWWLSLTVECEPKRVCDGTAMVGLDWGVTTFLSGIDSNGVVIEIDNPRWFQRYKDIKADLQRQLATKKRFSRAWKKVKAVFGKLESWVARCRLDWQHKLSADIASKYPLVAIEKLTIKNMTKSAKGTVEKPGKNVPQKAGLNREILDTAPTQFYQLTSYKVTETGSVWLETPTRKLKPSQRCPACWGLKRKILSERIHQCEDCSHTEPRDIASSRVNLIYAQHWSEGREPSLVAA